MPYSIREGFPHFLTFTVVEWMDIFRTNTYSDIFINACRHCQKEKGLIIHAWVIMSTHVHIIAGAREGFLLSNILRDLKRHTSKSIVTRLQNSHPKKSEEILSVFAKAAVRTGKHKNFQLWMRGNHPETIHSPEFAKQKLNYVHNNPVKAGLVEIPEDYELSSAIDYAGGKGLLEISHI